jgi:hypothetical protein
MLGSQKLEKKLKTPKIVIFIFGTQCITSSYSHYQSTAKNTKRIDVLKLQDNTRLLKVIRMQKKL